MRLLKLVIIFEIIAGLIFAAAAQDINRSASIDSLKGKVQVKLINEKSWNSAKVGMILHEGDSIRTSAGSWAFLNLDKGKTATVEVKENTQLLLSELKKNDSGDVKDTLLDLAIGKILIKVQKLRKESSKFEVKTPTSIVGVRGTVFAVEVENLK
ncbi:MAG: hypothetical protein B1H08_02995 [Candidatus Omnitrophica bacterium 4484_171]|nr:MAG: hypothetical protein B1H08_02995 [Candidatus Omnitrophica bacterium 4484_171]